MKNFQIINRLSLTVFCLFSIFLGPLYVERNPSEVTYSSELSDNYFLYVIDNSGITEISLSGDKQVIHNYDIGDGNGIEVYNDNLYINNFSNFS